MKGPRNILWLEKTPDKPGAPPVDDPLSGADLEFIARSEYTHVIVGFLHLDPGPKLVYNGPNAAEGYDFFWPKLQCLKRNGGRKSVLVSVGGWGSGTWKNIEGEEDIAAGMVADFVNGNGFDGVDLDFEGPYLPPGSVPSQTDLSSPNEALNYRNDPQRLAVAAEFAVKVRQRLPGKILTITPIYDNVVDQLAAIGRVAGREATTWSETLSWVNVQFYFFENGRAAPLPLSACVSAYNQLVEEGKIPAGNLVAGFPLQGEMAPDSERDDPGVLEALAAKANRQILLPHAVSVIRQLQTTHQDMGGAFVWAYGFTRYPEDLDWAGSIGRALRSRQVSL